MKTICNNTAMILLLAMTFAAVSSFPSLAAAEEQSPWQLKASLVLVDTSDPFAIDKPSGGQVHAGGNAELGASIAIEYRLSDLIGLELAAVYAKSPDVDDTVNGNNDEIGEGPGFFPILAGANFHLVNTERLDFYVGSRIAFVSFGDFDLNIDGQNTAFDVSDEFAWGATAGFSYQLGDSRWSFIAEATYLDVDMEITEKGTSNSVVNNFDPLMFNLGASYRF